MSQTDTAPYWRLSGFYFFFFASLGALLPYWSLYLQSLEFSPLQIGWLMALLHGTKLVAPNVWGWLADRSGRRMPVIQWGAGLALVCFCVIFLDQSFWLVAAVMLGFGFFWNAMLPQFEAVTFTFLGRNTNGYSRIRLWGSVGFVLTVLVLGWYLDRIGIGQLPLVFVALLAGIWLISLSVSEPESRQTDRVRGSILGILRQPPVLVFLIVCLLLQMSHGPYYVFFSIYLEDHGYSKPHIGQLWALGVVAEIVLFYWMQHIVSRVSLQAILMFSLGLTSLRWLLTAWGVDYLAVLLLAQLLHAASFGAFHVAAIHLVHYYFRGEFQGRGQALYSSISFGAGGMLGSLYSGYLWQDIGPKWVYSIAALTSLAAAGLIWKWPVAGQPMLDEVDESDLRVLDR